MRTVTTGSGSVPAGTGPVAVREPGCTARPRGAEPGRVMSSAEDIDSPPAERKSILLFIIIRLLRHPGDRK